MIVIFLILALSLSAHAQFLDPQTAGRGGVHDLSQKSGNTLGWNPAALGPDRGFRMSFDIPSLMASVSNNAFSVSYWNDHVAGDRFLTNDDKLGILDKIPGGGLRTNVQAAVPALGFSYDRFGIRVVGESASQMVMPKDVAALALMGNELDRRYNFETMMGESQNLLDIGAGFAYQFEQERIPDLYFGACFHFYQGMYLSKLEQVNGDLTVTDSLITGSAVFHGVTSNRGDGVGFDLGSLAVLSSQWEVGLSLRQIGARLTWDVDKNYRISAYADSVPPQADSLIDGNLESSYHYADTTYEGGVVESKLPAILQANALFHLNPQWNLMGELQIYTTKSVLGNAGLQLGAAAEYCPLRMLALQAGGSLGGPWKSQIGLGAGLRFDNYQLDIGGSWIGGMFGGVRGVSFGISQKLMF